MPIDNKITDREFPIHNLFSQERNQNTLKGELSTYGQAQKNPSIRLRDSVIQVSTLTNLGLFDVDGVGSFFTIFDVVGNFVVLSNFVN